MVPDQTVSASGLGRRDLDVKGLLAMLRRRRWSVVSAGVVGMVVALAYVVVIPPVYSATSEVLLQQSSAAALATGVQPVALTPTDIQTQMELVTSSAVEQQVRHDLHHTYDVSVSEVAATNVMAIKATSGSPRMAARIANAYANAYINVRRTEMLNSFLSAANDLQGRINSLQSQLKAALGSGSTTQADAMATQVATLKQQLVQVQVSANMATGDAQLVNPAVPPLAPSSPRPLEDTAAGLFVGLAAGVGIGLVREYMDETIKTKADVEEATVETPVLGVIPAVQDWKKKDETHLISFESPSSPTSEAYRALRTSLQFIGIDRKMRVIQITSPIMAEGKSTTIANLAITLAQAGQRVIVVCADLRRPRLHHFFGLDNAVGLSSVILGEISLAAALQPITRQPGLYLLASGPLPPQPAELLGSRRGQEVFAELPNHADVVLIDSPPVLPVTDAAVISGNVDATLLVASAGKTTRAQLSRAFEVLTQVGAPVVGAILNGASHLHGYSDKYAGYAYTYTEKKSQRRPGGRHVERAYDHVYDDL